MERRLPATIMLVLILASFLNTVLLTKPSFADKIEGDASRERLSQNDIFADLTNQTVGLDKTIQSAESFKQAIDELFF